MSGGRWPPSGATHGIAALAVVITILALLASSAVGLGVIGARIASVEPRPTVPVQLEGSGAPTLSIAGASPSLAGLTWTTTSDLTFSEYEVQQSTAASAGPWTTDGTLTSQSDSSFYASGLTAGTTYWWQVVEVDALGIDSASNVVQHAQPSVAALTASPLSSSSVQLSWVNHASYGGSVEFQSYTIWQSSGGGSATSIGTITSESTTTATPGGLSPGTSYTFQVETSDGCRSASNCGSGTATATTYSNSASVTPSSAAATDYAAAFSESGLPSGSSWSVTLNGSTQTSTTSAIDFPEPNGSYAYTVGAPTGYTSSPSSGTVTIAGSAVSQALSFGAASQGSYSVTFSESGLPTGTTWWATLATSNRSSTGSTIVYNEANGSYTFAIHPPRGYSASPASGTVTVAGGAVTTSVAFSYASAPATASISHVVLVLLENEEVTGLWAAAPYERYLAATYGNATQFYAVCHDSSADYFAVTSGETFGCSNAYPNPGFSVTQIGDLFERANLTWAAYQESMPSACDLSSSGYYINYHDPFVYYQDLNRNATRCDAHVISAATFNQSVEAGDLPAFSFYTPNWEHDGHGPTNSPWSASTGLTHVESWLRSFLPPILNHTGAFDTAAEQTLVNHTAFVLLYDEGTTDLGYTVGGIHTTGCYNQTGKYVTACGGHVQLTVISPYSLHRQYTADATTYSVQSTIEWLFGLSSDGGLDGTSNFPAMTSLFSFSSNNYPRAPVRLGHPASVSSGGERGAAPGGAPFPTAEFVALVALGGAIGATGAGWAVLRSGATRPGGPRRPPRPSPQRRLRPRR